MNRLSLITAFALSGCVSFAPPDVELRPISAPAPRGALECALGRTVGLGYVVEAAEAGVFFKASRVRTPGSFDIVQAVQAGATLTVVASLERRSSEGNHAYESTESGVADAGMIVRVCGAG